MPVWNYSGIRQSGERTRGLIDADSLQSARQKLKKEGILPVSLEPHSREEEARVPGTPSGRRRLSGRDLSTFTRQLSILVGAGVPIVEALGAILDQGGETAPARIASQIRDRVKEGRSLSVAMGSEPGTFSPIYLNMVRAGEESGTLEIMLNRLADLLEKQSNTRRKVMGSLFYPVMLLGVGVLMVVFLLIVVMPRITSIFEGLKATLPLPTRILMGSSAWLRSHLLSTGLSLLAGVFLLLRFVRTRRATLDRWALRIPRVGDLVLATQVARFSRTLGVLLSSGTPLQKAMEVSEAVVTSGPVREAVARARRDLAEGVSLSRSLRESKVFPLLAVHMIAVGERSGKLEELLQRLAEGYEQEVDQTIGTLTSLIEPVMILFIGGIVLFMVMSVLLPIFEMSQTVQ
ncbi:MAG: type II secretion system F family protein [Nitrospirae bacterium]|nr:type II secretion system F family protein [Nitrospirota bacterium]MCL5284166.1 type II secretion system F family protein [Nitrospirota bacterium]